MPNTTSLFNKLLPTICGGLITISISLSSWTMKEVIDIRSKVAAMEANHLTSQDGLLVWKELAAVKEATVKNSEKIIALPLQGPPTWFVDQQKAMEARVEERIDKLERKSDAQHTEKVDLLNKLDTKIERVNQDNKDAISAISHKIETSTDKIIDKRH